MRKTKKEILKGIDNIKSSLVYDNNTVWIRFEDDSEVYRLHNTNIVTIRGKQLQLNSGGWRTLTTKTRINRILSDLNIPFQITQKNHIWHINDTLFHDGITINTLTLKIQTDKSKQPDIKVVEKKKKEINCFIKLLDKMDTIPIPSIGDCWDCALTDTRSGIPLGDIKNNHYHLKMHIKENYLHGSLINNALIEAGYRFPDAIIKINARESIKRALRRYLYKRLIPEIGR